MQELRPKSLFADRYRLRKRLGGGVFSETWLAINEVAGSEQAVKAYTHLDERGERVFRREYARAYHLMHPRLLRPTYFDIDEGRPYLVLPYCRRGSASRLAGKLSEGEIARAMRDIGGALAYIHQPAYRIVHRGVRPENILLSEEGHYLLSDFGISPDLRKELHRQASLRGISITDDAGMVPLAYRAPECTEETEEDSAVPASDIWAFGATLYELAAGHPPFGADGEQGQRAASEPASLPPPFSWPLNNILIHCMARAPRDRPTAENLRQMAEEYMDNGQWPSRYLGDGGPSWKRGRGGGIRKRIGRRVALAAAVLALAALALLAWPTLGRVFHSAGESGALTDTGASQPDTRRLPVKNSEPTDTAGEPKEPAVPGAAAQPEGAQPAAPSALEENQPPAPKEITPPTGAPQPKPENPVQKDTTGEKQNPSEAKKPAEGPALRPRFNELTGKWGYVDKENTWVIWPQFEEASPFKDGRAKVAKKVNDSELRYYNLDPNGGLILITKRDTLADQEN